MNEHVCPRRAENGMAPVLPFLGADSKDTWLGEVSKRTCSYCGSLHPEDFLAQVLEGVEVIPTDKNYKAYLGLDQRHKFYFQHLDTDQRVEFIRLFNDKTMKVVDGFYVMPYFCRKVGK